MFSHLNNVFTTDLEPSEFYLSPNYPNPFKKNTIIKYCVPYRTSVLLTVYNEKNEEIINLVDEVKNPGTYEVEFDASICHSCESGNPKEETFFYRFEAGDYKNEIKMLRKT